MKNDPNSDPTFKFNLEYVTAVTDSWKGELTFDGQKEAIVIIFKKLYSCNQMKKRIKLVAILFNIGGKIMNNKIAIVLINCIVICLIGTFSVSGQKQEIHLKDKRITIKMEK